MWAGLINLFIFLADPHQWSCKLKRNPNVDRWKTLLRHQGFSPIRTTSKLVQVTWICLFFLLLLFWLLLFIYFLIYLFFNFAEVSLETPIFIGNDVLGLSYAAVKKPEILRWIIFSIYFSVVVYCGSQMDSSARMIWDLPEDDAYRLAVLPFGLFRGISVVNIGMGLLGHLCIFASPLLSDTEERAAET